MKLLMKKEENDKEKDAEKETREDLEKAETNLHNVKKKKYEAVAEERGERRRLEILQTNLQVYIIDLIR